MKRLSYFVMPPLLSLTLTLSPVMAQSPSAPKSDDTKVDVEQSVAQAPSSEELGQKGSEKPVLNALPPSDTSTPHAQTSKAVLITVIVAGAAAVVAIILALHGGHSTATVLAPGTATVGPGQ
jgi:hypothetical protein